MPTGKRELYTKEQKTKVISMYREGKSLSEIAATTKIGHGSLYRILHQGKVTLRGRTPPAPTAKAKAAPPPAEPVVDAPEVTPRSPKVSALKAKLKDAMEMNTKLKSLIVEMMLDKRR